MERTERFSMGHFFIRLLVGTIVLAVTAALTPGFSISNAWSLVLAAIVLSILDWLVTKMSGVNVSPYGRGIVGFVLAATLIYVTQYFVSGYSVTILGAIIGALVYGIIDAILPGRAM